MWFRLVGRLAAFIGDGGATSPISEAIITEDGIDEITTESGDPIYTEGV